MFHISQKLTNETDNLFSGDSFVNLLTGHDVYVRSRIALFQWV